MIVFDAVDVRAALADRGSAQNLADKLRSQKELTIQTKEEVRDATWRCASKSRKWSRQFCVSMSEAGKLSGQLSLTRLPTPRERPLPTPAAAQMRATKSGNSSRTSSSDCVKT
jgi:hypothetical protein